MAIATRTATSAARTEARGKLREMFPRGSRVHVVLRHVSRSGMLRHISVLHAQDGAIRDVSYLVARALDYRRDLDDGGIVVHGAGMDMGFELVYNLSMALYCPSHYDHDGAYALTKEWV